MAKYRLEVRSVVYHTYEIDVPDDIVDDGDIEEYFYEMDGVEQEWAKLDEINSTEWEVESIEKIEG
jgi:hypothetical protein